MFFLEVATQLRNEIAPTISLQSQDYDLIENELFMEEQKHERTMVSERKNIFIAKRTKPLENGRELSLEFDFLL